MIVCVLDCAYRVITRNQGECECSFEGTQLAAIRICDGKPWNFPSLTYHIVSFLASRWPSMVANEIPVFQATISSL